MSIELYDASLQVYHLRMAGFSFAEIGEKLGISHGEAANTFLTFRNQQAARISPEDRAVSLELEVERLDQLQSAYYGEALAGDLKAAEFVLRLIIERAKLKGLDKADGTDAAAVANILVVGGNQQEFIEALNNGRRKRLSVASDTGEAG